MKIDSKAVALALTFIFAMPHVRAQTTATAPLPSQLTTATTAFLANAGLDNADSTEAYNVFYQGLTNWNHFQLKPTPAAAELTFELQANFMMTAVSNRGSDPTTAYLRLVIRDTKTGALLWSLVENVHTGLLEKVTLPNIDAAAAKLLTDLKAVTSPSTTSAPQ